MRNSRLGKFCRTGRGSRTNQQEAVTNLLRPANPSLSNAPNSALKSVDVGGYWDADAVRVLVWRDDIAQQGWVELAQML